VTGVVGNDDFDPVRLEMLTFIASVGNMLNYLMAWTGSTIGFGIAVVFGVLADSLVYAVTSANFRIETFSSLRHVEPSLCRRAHGFWWGVVTGLHDWTGCRRLLNTGIGLSCQHRLYCFSAAR